MLLSSKNIIIRHSSRAPVLRRLLQWDTFYLYCFWFSFKKYSVHAHTSKTLHDSTMRWPTLSDDYDLSKNGPHELRGFYPSCEFEIEQFFYREQIGPNSIVLIRYGWVFGEHLVQIWQEKRFGSDILSERWFWPDRKKRQFCQKSVILRYLLCMEFAYFSPGANRV